MGTRADFYVGRGKTKKWIGSIAFDGYRITEALMRCKSEKDFRRLVAWQLSKRDDATLPEQGWPWPWDDSSTTDYAYAFFGGRVRASCFGGRWYDPMKESPRQTDDKPAAFPKFDPKGYARPGDPRSGLMTFRVQT